MTNKFKKRARALASKTGMKYEAAHRMTRMTPTVYPTAIVGPDFTPQQTDALKRFWDCKIAKQKLNPRLMDPTLVLELVLRFLKLPEDRLRIIASMRSAVNETIEFVGTWLKEPTPEGFRRYLRDSISEVNLPVTPKQEWAYAMDLFGEFLAMRDVLIAFAPKEEHPLLESALEVTCQWSEMERVRSALRQRANELRSGV